MPSWGTKWPGCQRHNFRLSSGPQRSCKFTSCSRALGEGPAGAERLERMPHLLKPWAGQGESASDSGSQLPSRASLIPMLSCGVQRGCHEQTPLHKHPPRSPANRPAGTHLGECLQLGFFFILVFTGDLSLGIRQVRESTQNQFHAVLKPQVPLSPASHVCPRCGAVAFHMGAKSHFSLAGVRTSSVSPTCRETETWS